MLPYETKANEKVHFVNIKAMDKNVQAPARYFEQDIWQGLLHGTQVNEKVHYIGIKAMDKVWGCIFFILFLLDVSFLLPFVATHAKSAHMCLHQ